MSELSNFKNQNWKSLHLSVSAPFSPNWFPSKWSSVSASLWNSCSSNTFNFKMISVCYEVLDWLYWFSVWKASLLRLTESSANCHWIFGFCWMTSLSPNTLISGKVALKHKELFFPYFVRLLWMQPSHSASTELHENISFTSVPVVIGSWMWPFYSVNQNFSILKSVSSGRGYLGSTLMILTSRNKQSIIGQCCSACILDFEMPEPKESISIIQKGLCVECPARDVKTR